MEVNTTIKLYASIGMSLGLLIGCGGSSGSGDAGNGGSGSSLVTLSPETSNAMANNVSAALPGCTYNPLGAAAIPSEDVAVRLYMKTVDNILQNNANLSAREINEEYQGDCAVPGSYSITGTHENGVDDLIYTFSGFCTMTEDGSSTVDGILNVKNTGIPSATGPIPQSSAVSTGSGGLQITEATSEGTFNHSANISNLMLTYGNGDQEATSSNPDRIEIGALVVVDGRENSEFNVSNVDVTSYTSGMNNVVQIGSISFTDPGTGMVNISSTPLEIDENGVLLDGSVMASGGEGSEMILERMPTVDNAFDVLVGGAKLGVMNCTEF